MYIYHIKHMSIWPFTMGEDDLKLDVLYKNLLCLIFAHTGFLLRTADIEVVHMTL